MYFKISFSLKNSLIEITQENVKYALTGKTIKEFYRYAIATL